MAGQARREHRQRSSPVGSALPARAAVSAVASGSAIATTTPPTPSSATELHTRSTYRNLVLRGLAPEEATNLTAWLAGLAVGETSWTLRQINDLLFLRAIHRTSLDERSELPPH
jgi:hypothetical protein